LPAELGGEAFGNASECRQARTSTRCCTPIPIRSEFHGIVATTQLKPHISTASSDIGNCIAAYIKDDIAGIDAAGHIETT